MKQVVLIFFAFLLFFGNIGISVFKHICEDAGVSTSYFLAKNKCVDEAGIDSCCDEKEDDEKNCCSDELQIIQIQEKYLQNYSNLLFLTPEFEASNLFTTIFLKFSYRDKLVAKKLKAPPPKSGKSILLKHHVLRI